MPKCNRGGFINAENRRCGYLRAVIGSPRISYRLHLRVLFRSQ